jgi:hypothetical protein
VKIRTVTFEITRHGPPHNQLISPLTQYLAQSGPYEAVTLQLPWEHWRFLRELRVLRYGSGDGRGADASPSDAADIGDIAGQVSGLFKGVPGLIAGLSGARDAATLTHLRLIFSPSELSMVPFEIARSPGGFPSEGDFLSTQAVAPLVMTREIRGATGRARAWPRVPKVLFAWAQPPGFSDVPWRAHLQALVGALRPWTGLTIPRGSKAQSRTPAARLSEHLTMLPQATLSDIGQACASHEYTHVHVLAHGGPAGPVGHQHYALLLRGAVGASDPDRVSGERLAVAVTGQLACPQPEGACFSCPAVVTLANCDSGNQGSVVLPGSSLAHTLHSAGVPLVVGSLFPLSKRGSIKLTQELYGRLLSGDDPRAALHHVRIALRMEDTSTHDWASVVAYASFSEALDGQVRRSRYEASNRSIAIINSQVEESLGSSGDKSLVQAGRPHETLQRLLDDLDRAGERLPTTDGYEIEGNGRLASKNKRKAQAYFELAEGAAGELQEQHLRTSFAALGEAAKNYRAGGGNMQSNFRWSAGAPHWILTQALCAEAALGRELNLKLWKRAFAASQLDLDSSEEMVAWAHGSLLELHLLQLLLRTDDSTPPDDEIFELALTSTDLAVLGGRLNPYIVESTERQIERYTIWWNQPLWRQHLATLNRPQDPRWAQVVSLANQILTKLKKQGEAA